LHLADSMSTWRVAEHDIDPSNGGGEYFTYLKKTARKPGSVWRLVENIDIVGPRWLRSAAQRISKTWPWSLPGGYEAIATEMVANHGAPFFETRWRLARQAFTVPRATTRPFQDLHKIATGNQDGFRPRSGGNSAFRLPC